ncbi:MAG: fructose-1,6-bisphosphatase [Epsilonproteobacteria bacterium]|nr:fructose-1,6-bisphosphatase [Campylobacterota bacterium]
MAKLIYLMRHLRESGTDRKLQQLILELSEASKYIAHAIKTGEMGYAGTSNLYGEYQLTLDVLADKIIKERLDHTGLVSYMISEEMNGVTSSHKNSMGPYSVCYDPLDGSSLIDANLSIGTIISVMPGKQILQPGKNQVAALYFLYGPRAALIYTVGNGTHLFVLNDAYEYILQEEYITLNGFGNTYAPGGLKQKWTSKHAMFIHYLEDNGYKLRYSGAFAADVNHLIAKKGGVFTYPALKDEESGKLRLLFELFPMAFIMEQAGGAASNGTMRILDIEPSDFSQRSPIYIGSKKEVRIAGKYLKKI